MYDVAIIGAGLAGLQVARLLARAGASVLVADRRRNVTDCVRTTGIFVRRTFEDFPSLTPFLGPSIKSIGIHSPAGQTIQLASERDEFRVGKMKPLYESMLQQAVAAGATWLPSTTFERLFDEGTHIRLSFRERRNIKARFVVGADGARSRVGRDLRLDENDEWIVGVEDVFLASGSGSPRFDCWIDPEIAPGYLAWIVDDGEEIHAGVGGHRDRFNAASALRLFENRMRSEGGLPDVQPLERRGGLIPVNGVLRTIATARGLLVGDAAGAVSPLTAGGLDACMRLSRHAAAVLIDSLRHDTPICSYDGSGFRSRFASRLGMRLMFDMATRSTLAIELGFAIGRTTLANRVVRHVFFGRGSFPDVQPRPNVTASSTPPSSARSR